MLETIQSFIRDLPQQTTPQALIERLSEDHPQAVNLLNRDKGLLTDVLALAAWSPLLATTIEQNPHYLQWLLRERTNTRVRTREELMESLARFALTNSSVSPQVILARFRRRELLRTYLHDVRAIHTLVETTEELSNLADAILDYALNLARQELDNRYGLPTRKDERGRTATADFAIVALGKLGSNELNYASDIDLMFIYSDEGMTSGTGERGEVTNREYFVKLAEIVTRMVGQPSGEGAAYRVDLRLRPHGRDGAMASSLNEAIRYYREKAQAWELQALIRSRTAAGAASLFTNFFNAVRDRVFRPAVSVAEALASVRLAKQKIDRHREADRSGFNVKLHRGGIREIEFIAQALQLAHGGRDEWLRAPHTLISLGRLADRHLIHEQERTELSDAYFFLRKLEHRLQMEQGLQTHIVPAAEEARALVARRMDFKGTTALKEFDAALTSYTDDVRKVFDRVFAEVAEPQAPAPRETTSVDVKTSWANAAAVVFFPHLRGIELGSSEELAEKIRNLSLQTLNPHRALAGTARIAASLDKSTRAVEVSEQNLQALVRLSGASDFFADLLASNPSLVSGLSVTDTRYHRPDFRALLRAAVDEEKTFAGELSAFRKQWAQLLIEIGQRDAVGDLSASESNRLQTELATAAINVSYLIARRELARKFGRMNAGPRIAVLGFGRLGTRGVDYGSDLDVVMVYDSLVPSPLPALTKDEAYARLTELMIAALSNITREGYLYRVDLRLRPNGHSGPLVVSSDSFLEYIRTDAKVWEWLAYVKLRAVAGDMELAKMIETHARHAVHQRARGAEPSELRDETRRVRDRLEQERRRGGRKAEVDIKYSAGGMLDVYFASRYLQLRDDVPDEGEDRSTSSTLDRLEANGSLSARDYDALANGYALLRSVDHHLRLMIGKSASLPAVDHPVTRDIALKLNFKSASDLRESLRDSMKAIRAAYDRITGSTDAGK